jgi:hypothetical protein
MKKRSPLLVPALLASFTLGLMPFSPEPHLVGKIRWVMGGAEGMQAMDYFDLLLHGAPWLVLVYALAKQFRP